MCILSLQGPDSMLSEDPTRIKPPAVLEGTGERGEDAGDVRASSSVNRGYDSLPEASPWEGLGSWEGLGEGLSGVSRVCFFSFVLNCSFILFLFCSPFFYLCSWFIIFILF